VKNIKSLSPKEKFELAFQLKEFRSWRKVHLKEVKVPNINEDEKMVDIFTVKNNIVRHLINYSLLPTRELHGTSTTLQTKTNYHKKRNYSIVGKTSFRHPIKDSAKSPTNKLFIKTLRQRIAYSEASQIQTQYLKVKNNSKELLSYIKRTIKNSQSSLKDRLLQVNILFKNWRELSITKLNTWTIKHWIYRYVRKNCSMNRQEVRTEIRRIFNKPS